MRKRLILLTVDCLRRDRLKIHDYKKNICPNINRFTNNAIVFKNAIANGPHTPASFYAIFTSDYAGLSGFYHQLPNDKKTFVECLKSNKILTCGIHSNPYLGRFFNYNRGFDYFFDLKASFPPYNMRKKMKYYVKKLIKYLKIEIKIQKLFQLILRKFNRNPEKKSLKVKRLVSPYSNAKNLINESIRWIKKHYNSNFFLWIHLMDAHGPYYPPSRNINKISDEKITEAAKLQIKNAIHRINMNPELYDEKYLHLAQILYDAEINYLDHYIGILFMFLKRIKIYNKTNIIITADHGEAFYEHKFFGHHKSLYDELLRVPLFIKLDNANFNHRIMDAQVALIDLAPTILDLFGLPPEKQFVGKSLVPLIKNDINYSHPEFAISSVHYFNDRFVNIYPKNNFNYYLLISCRNLNWKLIYNQQKRSFEFFNLQADPLESKNLVNSNDEDTKANKNNFTEKINSLINRLESEEELIKKAVSKLKL